MFKRNLKTGQVSRRDMLAMSGRSLLAAFLVRHAVKAGYASETGNVQLQTWIRQLDDVSARLGQRAISALQWQETMDQLYGSVPRSSLLAMIDFDRLSEQLSHCDLGAKGEIFHDIALGPIPACTKDSPASSRTAIVKVAHIKKGRSVPPHGHSNMVSAFLCISGEFHVQLFDRLEDSHDSLVVRQSVDEKAARPGSWSSISDYRDNVHWLTAKSDDCFLFTCKLIRLEPDREFHGRININMRTAEELGSNTWRAEKITGKQAMEIY